MLLKIIIFILLQTNVFCAEIKQVKPYMFPVPLELPYRNERADQCWLRIEDVELVETVAIYCHIAHAFLGIYIHEYNSRKMSEDGVDVSLWNERPPPGRLEQQIPVPVTKPHEIKDWRLTTIMDPTVHRRLYVSKNADCRLVMYSREGMTNYLVNCTEVLYFINVAMSGSAVISYGQNLKLIVASLFLVYLLYNT